MSRINIGQPATNKDVIHVTLEAASMKQLIKLS